MDETIFCCMQVPCLSHELVWDCKQSSLQNLLKSFYFLTGYFPTKAQYLNSDTTARNFLVFQQGEGGRRVRIKKDLWIIWDLWRLEKESRFHSLNVGKNIVIKKIIDNKDSMEPVKVKAWWMISKGNYISVLFVKVSRISIYKNSLSNAL